MPGPSVSFRSVVFTTATTESYGSTRVARRHAQALIAAGVPVTVAHHVTDDRGPSNQSPLLEGLIADGVRIRAVPGLASWRCFLPGSTAQRIVAETGADTIVSTQMRIAAPTAWIARRLGLTSVALVQNHPNFSGRPMTQALKRLAYRLALRSADRVVCVSANVATIIEQDLGIDPSRVGILPNLIGLGPPPDSDAATRAETRRSLDVDDDAFLVVNVGRFHRQKGQVDLVEALSTIEHANVVLVFVGAVERSGSPDYLAEIQHQVSEAGLDSHVRFAGYRDDVRSVLEAADVFVLPSLWEAGPSLALLEAMAAECAVLATDHGDRVEGFIDTVHGLYVPAGEPDELARGLSWMLARSEEERQTMGREARALVQERHERVVADAGLAEQLELAIARSR